MKMNNKGYASTIIMFSVLALFLVSMLVLVKTMNNSSTLNKSIKSNVIDEINYGDSTSLKQQVAQLTEDVKALQKYKDEQVDPMITALNTSDFVAVTAINKSTKANGGYKKIGNMVIVNVIVQDPLNFETTIQDSNGQPKTAYLSENINSPTPILKGLPTPATSDITLTAVTYYCVNDGICGPSYMFSILKNDGLIYLSENLDHKYHQSYGIRIFGTYIAK